MKRLFKEEAVKYREKGLTFQEIGMIYNISRQRVHQILNSTKKIKPCRPCRTCNNCSKKFEQEAGIKYCSECLLKGLKFLTGRDFNRERIRMRDNHTCKDCHKKWEKGKRRFDVHHIDNDKEKSRKYDLLEKEEKNMITLCHKCHFQRHY